MAYCLVVTDNEESTLLLICLTLSSRKDLSITPCFIGVFSFHMQGSYDGFLNGF